MFAGDRAEVETELHAAEHAVILAAQECLRRTGRSRVTMDDVCSAAGISRATLYRIFPGGRDVLFEAVRRHSIGRFFGGIRDEIEDAASLEDLLVRIIVASSQALRHDAELANHLATLPGEALGDLTLDGLAQIISMATEFLTPFTDPFVDADAAAEIVDITVRLVISYYLSPSWLFDLSDPRSTAWFVREHLLPRGDRPAGGHGAPVPSSPQGMEPS